MIRITQSWDKSLRSLALESIAMLLDNAVVPYIWVKWPA